MILVVEDRFDWNTTFAVALNAVGYETVHAHNGSQARRALDEHSADINAAIVDLILPDPRKVSPWDPGVAVCRMLAGQHIPYILCTVVAKEDIPEGTRASAADYIKKPLLDEGELLAAIARAMQASELSHGRS